MNTSTSVATAADNRLQGLLLSVDPDYYYESRMAEIHEARQDVFERFQRRYPAANGWKLFRAYLKLHFWL